MNNLKQHLNLYQACKKDMTYILGAKCRNGIVLVGDTKVTIDGGADSSYGGKITMPFPNSVVMGAAGIGGFYKDFLNRVLQEVDKVQKQDSNSFELSRIEGFSILVGRVLKNMGDYYSKERHLFLNNLQILCATRINDPIPQLHMFNPIGFSEPVTQSKAIGSGVPYVKLFLKHIWKSNMTMEQTAKLGLFNIKLIKKMNLDNFVGYTEEFPPQVYYISKGSSPIEELSKSKVNTLIGEIDSEITNLDNLLKNFKV